MNPKVQKYLEALAWAVLPVVLDVVIKQLEGGSVDWRNIGAFSLVTLLAYLRTHPPLPPQA